MADPVRSAPSSTRTSCRSWATTATSPTYARDMESLDYTLVEAAADIARTLWPSLRQRPRDRARS